MTLGTAYDRHIKKCTAIFIKQYINKWMYGNDGWYYYVTNKSSDDIFALKSNGKNIIDLIKITINDASSFEEIEDNMFRSELEALLCKAYLVGVYVERKVVTGWYKWKTEKINIMEKV